MGPQIDATETDTALPAQADVVVIGGGIIGISAALHLARQGVSVLLCEKGKLAGEQSSRNWGWVRKTGRDLREVPLIIEALRMWGEFKREGLPTGFTECGVLYVATKDADRERYERWIELVAPYQMGSRIVEGDELAELLPGASKRFGAALYTKTDGRAEPQKAVPALAAAARAAGAVILENCAVRGLDLAAGRVVGVVTERGRVGCNSAILASGAWSRLFCGSMGLRLPQLKVRSSVLRTAPVAGGPETSAWLGDFAIRKRSDGGYTVANGSANIVPVTPDTFRFFADFLPAARSQHRALRLRLDDRFMAEARTPKRWDLDKKSPFETTRTLDPDPVLPINNAAVSSLQEVFPAFRGMQVAQQWAGMIDVTPDAVPVISAVDTVPGLVIATGFSGHGFGIGPAAGRLAAEIATAKTPLVDPTPFRYSRFTDGTPISLESASKGAIAMDISRRKLLITSAVMGAAPRLARAQGKPKPGGQVVIGLSQEPTVFDPRRPHIEVDEGVYMALYSPLWGVSPSGQMIPRLALEVPTVANGGLSADGLTWSIKLRPGVKWHDGTPFTSADVAYTLTSVMQPDFPAYSRTGHELVENIQTPAPDRITWTMKKPFAPYISILSWFYIVPKHKLESEPVTGGHYADNPIGTGPFKWQERVPGDHITLAANTDYFGDGPLLGTAIYKYIPDLTVLFTQFRTGDIDYIGLQGISADHYAEAKKLADRKVYTAPEAFIENFYFNLGLPQFQEKAVRQAIYYAYDKDSIIQQLYYGLPGPSESYLPKQSWAFNPNLPKHEYSIDKAKATLDAAGWKPGADGVRVKNGVRLAFTNSTTAGNHLREQVQQFLQQDFQQAGIEMTIKNLPAAVMWGDYWIKSHFETAIVGINFMVGPDPDASDYFSSTSIAAKTGSGQNTMQYSNPEVDKLLQEGAAELDQAKRIPIYQRLQEVLREDLAFLPQQQYSLIEGTKSRLMGYEPNINVRLNTWNIETWHWVEA